MRDTLRKLIVGKGQRDGESHSAIARRVGNLRAIWNNTYDEDAGLEKLVRLLLAAGQFLFPGMYLKHLFWHKGPLYQDLAIEAFVLFKTLFPLLVMHFGWWEHRPVVFLVIWRMAKTIIYIPTLIFASDSFPSPRSYRRSKLLLFLNYLEVVFGFAVVHMASNYMNEPLVHWIDAVYLSLVVTSTIGFGE